MVTVVLSLAGCASVVPAAEDSVPVVSQTTVEVPPTAVVEQATASAQVAPTSTVVPTQVPARDQAVATVVADPTTVPEPELVEPRTECARVTEFAGALQQQSWRVTLDGVMGGLSSGSVAFSDSTLIFSGELVTQGGGFSLLRTPMFGDEFVNGSYLMLRVRADGRRYEMVFKDRLEGRPRQLLHEAAMPLDATDDWQEVRVELTNLITTSNGRLVDAAPFGKDAVSEMGIIVKDGVDGGFALELDWIDICAQV